LGGALDVIIEPYNQELLNSAVIEWGTINSNGELPFTVTFTVDSSTPRNEYKINLNVISLDGGVTHSASVAFVTESSTLDGTAVAADSSSVSTGNTSQHDGTDSSATNLVNDDSSGNEDSNDNNADSNNQNSATSSESDSSNLWLIIASSIVIFAVISGIVVMTLRSKSADDINNNLNQQMWDNQSNQMSNPVLDVPQMTQMGIHSVPPSQIVTAPPPPAQPVSVSDYTGLPPGGQYDQSTGQTIYILPDSTRWQMMADGSFNRL